MTSEAGTPQPGEIIAGKYRVEKVLGAGAMGMVVAARHVDLGELRAIKIMLPSALSNAQAVERFLREARAVAKLKTDYVAKVHDIGRLDSGAPYIVMEHLEGRDLRAALDQHGQLPVAQAVSYVIETCEALAEAHAMGIVHRDLKPANLFLAQASGGATRVKVLDFGVAKVIETDGAGAKLTHTTMALGSPLYMSPEQVRSSRTVDARSDIWALGVILYESLTGRRPFEANTLVDLCAQIYGHTPPPPSSLRAGIPAALDAAVLRCLEKDREKRFATVSQLATAIAPYSGALAATATGIVVAPKLSVVQGAPPGTETTIAASAPAGRSMRPIVVGVLALLVVAAGVTAWKLASGRGAPPKPAGEVVRPQGAP
jgi:serine/threonine-protein kinase